MTPGELALGPRPAAPRGKSPPWATLLTLAAALAAWAAAAQLSIANRALVAGPLDTLAAVQRLGPPLLVDLLSTSWRAAAGLALGGLAGVPIGLAVAAAARRAPVADGLLEAVRAVPPVAWLPVFLLGLGWGNWARVATVATGVAFIMAAAVSTAARAPRTARAEQLVLAGAKPLARLRWTEPWQSLPALLVGLRISASMALVIATVAEMVAGATRGMGARLVDAQVAQDTPAITAAIAALGFAGWAAGRLLRAAERAARSLAGAP